MNNTCFNCPTTETTTLYGYKICQACAKRLTNNKDETIKKWIAEFKPTAESSTFAEDIQFRLDFVEKDYIKSKIKLLSIQDRLKELS